MKIWPIVLLTGALGAGVGLVPLLGGDEESRREFGAELRYSGDDDDDDDEEDDDEGSGARWITRMPPSPERPEGSGGSGSGGTSPLPALTASAPTPAGSMSTTAVTTYTKECGSCHVAFPPQLLPARSWDALLGNLADHFGDNAELPDPTRAELAQYLSTNAGDTRGSRAAARIPSGQTPLRITELSWFVGKHDEVPAAWVTGNPDVRSYANCAACHTGAAQGRYGEHEVRIPGHGGWEE